MKRNQQHESVADRLRKGMGKASNNGHAQPPKPEPPPDPEPPPTVETFTAPELMAMDLPEPRFVVDGVVSEGLNINAGKPKLGKSWMVLNTGIAVASGGIALGKIRVEEGDVLYLALEDTKRRLKSRLEILLCSQGGKPPPRLTLARKWPRQDKGGLDAIREWLDKHKEARLVIIDTWNKFRPPKFRGADPYEEDYRHGSELKAIADEYKIGIWAVTHCRKMGAVDPLEEVSGSIGITGCADAIQILRRERGQADATLFVTGRDIEEQELALKWDAQYALWSIIGQADEYRISVERKKVQDVLRKEGKPMTPAALAPLIEKTPGATRKLLWTMAAEGQVMSLGNGQYICSNRSNTAHSGNCGNSGNISEDDSVTERYRDGFEAGNADYDSKAMFP